MDKVLLDTDILTEVFKARNEPFARNAAAYHRHFGYFTLSAVTVMEVVKGFQKALALLATEEPGASALRLYSTISTITAASRKSAATR